MDKSLSSCIDEIGKFVMAESLVVGQEIFIEGEYRKITSLSKFGHLPHDITIQCDSLYFTAGGWKYYLKPQ